VLFSVAGLVGDCALTPPPQLFLDTDAQARLPEDEETYRRCMASREVARCVPRNTLSAGSLCMGYCLGVDNRALLGPFFPLERNEDGLFGFMTLALHPGGFAVQVPFAVVYDPPEPRSLPPRALVDAYSRFRLNDLMLSAVRSTGGLPATADAAARLVAIGRHLEDLAGLSEPDFATMIRDEWRRELVRRASILGDLLQRSDGLPRYWTRDLESALRRIAQSAAEEGPLRCADAIGRHAERSREDCRSMVLRFGQLMRAWPALWEAARDSNHREDEAQGGAG
jgi:hypothetical protein